jgi:hypothetical protein
MAKKESQVDIINQSVKQAGETAFRNVMNAINRLPNSFGVDTGEQLTQKDIERLARGE